MSRANQPILIIGSGPSVIGSENEADAALYQVITELRKRQERPVLLDNNAFSVNLTQLPANQVIRCQINYASVYRAIQILHPRGILPIFGGKRAVYIVQELILKGVLKRYHVRLIGISLPALRMVGSPVNFERVIKSCHERALKYYLVRSIQQAKTVAERVGFPVVIKSLFPKCRLRRKICKNFDRLKRDLTRYLNNSRVHQCILESNLTGYQEFSLVGIRDALGTQLIVSGLEDVDAVGINPGDSIVVVPVQTLTNPEYQQLRNATFRLMNYLKINGICDVQFAFDRSSRTFFVTKITPYFTRDMNLAARASGYPLLIVEAQLLLGNDLTELSLPRDYDARTKLLEPSLDHVLVKIPIWPFEDINDVDQHLGSLMQSVGSAVGVGRTVEEALLKALRSSQFSPRDVLPSLKHLSEDDLIDQLVHPQASRILVLIEALRRRYPVHDLTELTKIQPFYFYKLKRLLRVEREIIDHPGSLKSLVIAHNNGFGDGMLAETWQMPITAVQHLAAKAHTLPTYKQIEPSAGEFAQQTQIFYSSYERENEAQQLSRDSALVIGRGGNQLGPNTAADYYTAETLLQLKKVGFKPIVMNNNPNAISLDPQLSFRQYLEPVQLGNILDLIHLEQPQLIVIPGNRHFLLRQLTLRYPRRTLVLPPDQKTGVKLPHRADLGLDYFIVPGYRALIVPMKLIGNDQAELKYVRALKTVSLSPGRLRLIEGKANHVLDNSDRHGLVQVLFRNGHPVGARPLRTSETAFLNQITNVNWIQLLIRFRLGKLSVPQLRYYFTRLKMTSAQLIDNFPFRQLQVAVRRGVNSNQAVGARVNFL